MYIVTCMLQSSHALANGNFQVSYPTYYSIYSSTNNGVIIHDLAYSWIPTEERCRILKGTLSLGSKDPVGKCPVSIFGLQSVDARIAISYFRTILAMVQRASCLAKWRPGHIPSPPPNGMYTPFKPDDEKVGSFCGSLGVSGTLFSFLRLELEVASCLRSGPL